MIENEALRQQRLAAQRKAEEAGDGDEVSMEELAARAMAKREGKPAPEPVARPEPKAKPSTLGVYADGGDALVSEETKESLEVAGRMTVAAGKAIFSKSLEAAAIAKEKAREASRLAQEKLRAVKADRDERRVASVRAAEEKAAEKGQAIEQASMERPGADPAQQLGQVMEVELPEAWEQPIQRKPRVPAMAVGGLLFLIIGGGIAWWIFAGNKGSDPNVEAVPVQVSPQPSPPVIAAPAIVPVIEIPPAQVPDTSQEETFIPVELPMEEVAEPATVIEKKPESAVVPNAIDDPRPKPVQPVAPKQARVKKPIAPPAEKDQWQDKGIDQLDALEKQVGE